MVLLKVWFGGGGIRTHGSGVSGEGETRSGDYNSPALDQLCHAAVSTKLNGRDWSRTNDLRVSNSALLGALELIRDLTPFPLSYAPNRFLFLTMIPANIFASICFKHFLM